MLPLSSISLRGFPFKPQKTSALLFPWKRRAAERADAAGRGVQRAGLGVASFRQHGAGGDRLSTAQMTPGLVGWCLDWQLGDLKTGSCRLFLIFASGFPFRLVVFSQQLKENPKVRRVFFL